MRRALIPDDLLMGEYLFKRYGATLADYERLADEDTRLELLDGVLIMHSPANVRHEDLFGFIFSLVRGYVASRGLGKVLGSRLAMILEDERRFEPDMVFIKSEHLSRLDEAALMGPADLAVEILSPSTRDYDQGDKRAAYAAGKISEYWMIDPRANHFIVDRPAGKRFAELQKGRYESAAVEGFWLDVEWLWQDPLPDAHDCLTGILKR